MIRLVPLLTVLSACVAIDPGTAAWQPASSVTGELAAEVGPPPPAPPPPAVLRVATWNLHGGEGPAGFAAAILASPALAPADVLLLQEIDAYPGEPGTRAAQLAGALGMTWLYVPERPRYGGTHGNAILSRFPLVDLQVMPLPHVDQPIHERDRIAVRATVDLGDRAVTVVNVHLDTRLGAVDRIRQLDPAAAALPDPAVLGGDFNTNPWAWVETVVPLTGTEAIVGQDQAQVLDDYLQALGYATPIAHDEDTHTSPLSMRLDAVVARGAAVTGAGVARELAGSDHWPVWIDVAP